MITQLTSVNRSLSFAIAPGTDSTGKKKLDSAGSRSRGRRVIVRVGGGMEWGAMLGSLLVLGTSAGAQIAAPFAGDWTIHSLTTPTCLLETFLQYPDGETRTSRAEWTGSGDKYLEVLDGTAIGAEVLVNAFYPESYSTESRSFQLSAGGIVSGGVSGTVVAVSGNRITYTDAGEAGTVFANVSRDVLFERSRNDEEQSLTLCLKKPQTVTAADLAGTWHLVAFSTPADLTRNIGERLLDTYFTNEFDQVTGTITVGANGQFTGTFDGSLQPGSGTGVTLTVTGDDPLAFSINASRTVMVRAENGTEERDFVVMVKQPAAATVADIAGSWRFAALDVPTTLTETYYNPGTDTSRQATNDSFAQVGEFLVDVFHEAPFVLRTRNVAVPASGGSGISAGPGGAVTLPGFGGVTLRCNADHSVMIGGVTDGTSQAIIVGVKDSAVQEQTFAQRVDFSAFGTNGELPGLFFLNWNAAAGLVLEGSVDMRQWEAIPDAVGDSYRVDPASSPYRYFRVVEAP